MELEDRIAGALYGGAIGDGMGAPVEGWPAQKIAAQFSRVDEFLPPTHGGDPAQGKGNGRITDDTLMIEALMYAYLAADDHLDAHGFERYLIPEITDRRTWVPERQAEIAVVERLWWPEKYPWMRLTVNHAEPRTAGVCNCVNCGVAMYIWPVGAVNAGDPVGAYHEAVEIGAAHNESFAVEAAAVMAGATAAALGPDPTIDLVCHTARDLARDGTGLAIAACLDAVSSSDDLATFIGKVRQAVAPFDMRTGHTADDKPLLGEHAMSNIGRPSRLHSIEELPVALAALKWGGGEFLRTIQASVFYGRDCDSIAGMAGSLFGAIFGTLSIPEKLRGAVDRANRRNFAGLAAEFTPLIGRILGRDERRLAARKRAAGK